MLATSLIALTALSSVAQARPLWTRQSNIGDVGKCSVPQIEFAAGLDGRKETAFQAVDQTSFNHGSADNIAVITGFICQQLASSCGADATAQATCTTATNAANAAAAQTGAQADAFNAAFGITTNFAAVPEISNQGVTVAAAAAASTSAAASAAASTTDAAASSSTPCVTATAVTVTAIVTETASAAAAASTDDSAVCAATVTVMATVTAGATDSASATAAASSTASAAAASSTASSSDIGDFGSCTVPQIKFATGFDNRKETSFEPVDQVSYNHGSAQGIDIITKFMCDTLTNSCGADATAKATCATASAAADQITAKTGGQADAFNAAFGITTDFAAVPSVDDQGNIIAGTGSSSAAASSAATATAASASAAVTTTANAAVASSTSTASSSSIGDFGSCTVPQIQFATGFDNRKETSFEPVDQTSYNHGSAQNIDIITQFMCDTLTNSCGADATAKATCATAKAAADTVTAKTGGQADAFNAVFGITTNFAAVAVVSDTGVTVSPGTVASTAAASAATSAAAASTASTSAATSAAATATSAAAAATSSAAAASGQNLQTFTGSLGATAPAVTAVGNGQFQVAGNSAFNSEQNALVRSCDVQHNQCANAANSSGNTGDLTVDACGTQQTQCNAAATA